MIIGGPGRKRIPAPARRKDKGRADLTAGFAPWEETAAPVSAHFGLFLSTADWAQRYGSIRASTVAGNMRCNPSGLGAPPSSGWMA